MPFEFETGRGANKTAGYVGRDVMAKETCDICGNESEPGATEKQPVVPLEITEQAGIASPKTVRLCSNCRQELHRWYSTKVADMAYDTKVKRFRAKSSLEMVKEYETAYRIFAEYKRGQPKID